MGSFVFSREDTFSNNIKIPGSYICFFKFTYLLSAIFNLADSNLHNNFIITYSVKLSYSTTGRSNAMFFEITDLTSLGIHKVGKHTDDGLTFTYYTPIMSCIVGNLFSHCISLTYYLFILPSCVGKRSSKSQSCKIFNG